MKQIFITLFLLMGSTLVNATPPRNVTLAYDATTKNLKVEMDHVSKNLEDHYIRKIIVYLNGVEQPAIYNNRQSEPSKHSLSLPLSAKNGDTIVVKAYCKEGGVGEGNLSVAIEEKKEEKKDDASVEAKEQPTVQEPMQQAPAESPQEPSTAY